MKSLVETQYNLKGVTPEKFVYRIGPLG